PIELDGADGERVTVSTEEEILNVMTGIQEKLRSYMEQLDTESGLDDNDLTMARFFVLFWNNNVPIIEGWNRENEAEAVSGLKEAISEITKQDLHKRIV
ncbi:hypothetical protein OAS19_06075, partial [Altererythrobacter sp.]|nr:hypothetical protein [Altererythrobacter sp.]